jgi:hypothetical protein
LKAIDKRTLINLEIDTDNKDFLETTHYILAIQPIRPQAIDVESPTVNISKEGR